MKFGRDIEIGDIIVFGSPYRITAIVDYGNNPWGFKGWRLEEWARGRSEGAS